MTRYRNPLACHPLLKKGHVHMPSKASIRQTNERIINDALDEWVDDWDYESSNDPIDDLHLDEDIRYMFYEE